MQGKKQYFFRYFVLHFENLCSAQNNFCVVRTAEQSEQCMEMNFIKCAAHDTGLLRTSTQK